MILSIIAAGSLLLAPAPSPQRIDRLVALGRLDAAVRYFNPIVATRQSSWDSLFAAHAEAIADAPNSAEYGRRVAALMAGLHDDAPSGGTPQRRLEYNGFPTAVMQSSGGYQILWRDAGSGETYRVDMGEGVHVDVRTSEPSGDLETTVKPLPPSPGEGSTPYPAVGYRILAAARLWGTIRLFYPYKSLMGENWDDAFRAALPLVEQARDSVQFAKAIAAFASHIHDTHVTVNSAALRSYMGAAPIGASARLIEDQLVITRVIDDDAARAGLRIGDIVESVDGEPMAERIARLTPYLAASTPQSLRARLQSMLLDGDEGTRARLVVHGTSGSGHQIEVARSASFLQRLQKSRTGSIVRILPGNIGYIDLDRLWPIMVDSAFRVLAGTKAIVFDGRGYPLGTAWPIAPRLNAHFDGTTAAKFKRLVVASPDTARTTTFEFDQPIPPSYGVTKYTGKTVMLIDERTISQAEHTGLFFEAANGTEFIGTPTMGANGDITVLTLPGNITISFTGQGVRHADGRQLQRVGLLPRLAVAPTVAGIRAGRDEVLEAALRYVGGTGEVPPDTLRAAPAVVLAGEPMVPGWTQFGESFRIGLDRTVAHGGTSSGHLTARSAEPQGFGSFAQPVRADDYRGKRVRFSAWLKTRDVVTSGLWMRVDGKGGMLAFDNMSTRPVRGTTEWTKVSIVLDVPAEAEGIVVGVLLSSTGEVWIDDTSLEVVGSEVASTNTISPTTNAANIERQRAMYAQSPTSLRNVGFEANY